MGLIHVSNRPLRTDKTWDLKWQKRAAIARVRDAAEGLAVVAVI